MHRFERGPAAERQRRAGDAVQRHVEVAARKSVAMNLAGHDGGAPADRFVDRP